MIFSEDINHADDQATLVSTANREMFFEWLSAGNTKNFSPAICLSCIDKISEYARQKKISSVSLWEITRHDTYKTVYNKLLEAKLLRITDRNTYKLFITVGQLYFKFLREKPFARKATVATVVEEKAAESVIAPKFSQSAIDPEAVIAWLVTQPNANGALYLENVVRQYMRALRSAPAKLDIPFALHDRSVFSRHTSEELTTYWDILKAAPNYKQVNSSTSGMFSAGMGCLLRYLEHLSKTPAISEFSNILVEPIRKDPIEQETDSVGASIATGKVAIWDDTIELMFKAWLEREKYSQKTAYIYAKTVAQIFRRYTALKEKATIDSQGVLEATRRYIVLLGEDSGFRNDNSSRHNQFSAALAALERFYASGYSEEENITYALQSKEQSKHVPLATLPKIALDPAVIEKITDVLSMHFANGYRLNSPIELVRFRSFAEEVLGEKVILPDEELKKYIAACGTSFDGKVYSVSAEVKERIKELAEEYFADGAQAIFFSEFCAKNENWLFGASVVSKDMLVGILRRLFPTLSFTQTYFGYMDVSVFAALESEILRVWGDDVLLTYEQLAERLQYIPLDRIKYALGQNGDFIWSSVETFSHVSRIDIIESERKVIREAAVMECNARGYTSITDLPFGEIEERNFELSITAVHNAVYHICLSDKFDKKGKIITRKGDVFDALTIMKEYCRTIDKCSLDDLLNFEKELTGEVHRWIPMVAGNTILVRIDKDAYVADKYVHFNADVIDEDIGFFVKGDYLPLKSFTTFGAFPDCGQEWNLFLLESYCRRFSRKFRFDTPSVNSRNAGAVIRRSCGLDYTEIMTDAVAKADISLKDSVVGKFLYENGYMGRSTTAKVGEVIDKAKAIRRRD